MDLTNFENIIFVCKICGNTSHNILQEMINCCYDDFNLLELDSNYYYSIIKIQRWYKNKSFDRLLNDKFYDIL